jgi:hypothetical protein
MSRYAGELAPGGASQAAGIVVPPAAITAGGYPSGGAAGSAKYPQTVAIGVTTNPHGAANSAGENPTILAAPPGTPTGFAYSFRTWEEKALATVPAGVFA